MDVTSIWWGILFGGTLFGNLTMIGSTANIVALGLLEKHGHIHVRFWDWFKVGAVSAVVASAVAWAALTAASPLMARYAAAREWKAPPAPVESP